MRLRGQGGCRSCGRQPDRQVCRETINLAYVVLEGQQTYGCHEEHFPHTVSSICLFITLHHLYSRITWLCNMDVTKIILELLVINIQCKIQTTAEKQLLIATSIEPELDFSKLKNLFYFSCVCVCTRACTRVCMYVCAHASILGG